MNEELAYYEEQLSKIRPDKPFKEIRKDALNIAKQRWVKSGSEWVMRSVMAADLSKEAFFELMIKRDDLDEKPDFSTHEEGAVAAFKKYPHSFSLV